MKADLGEILVRDLNPSNKHFSLLMKSSAPVKDHISSPRRAPHHVTGLRDVFSFFTEHADAEVCFI